jgi:hypothetical protein
LAMSKNTLMRCINSGDSRLHVRYPLMARYLRNSCIKVSRRLCREVCWRNAIPSSNVSHKKSDLFCLNVGKPSGIASVSRRSVLPRRWDDWQQNGLNSSG